MHKLETHWRRFVFKMKHEYFTASNILAVIMAVVCGFFVWESIGATGHNWELQNKLQQLQLKSKMLKIEVDTLKLEQEFYKTPEYQELMAREKLGRMLPGETMVILPHNSQEAKEKHKKKDESSSFERSNFAQWMRLLSGNY